VIIKANIDATAQPIYVEEPYGEDIGVFSQLKPRYGRPFKGWHEMMVPSATMLEVKISVQMTIFRACNSWRKCVIF
jgi:hypothetical protein